MGKFHSAEPSLQTSTENDLVNEYLITVNPFEILITTQFPEIDTNGIDGLFTIIYGIGGLLIALVIFTCCYRIFMPIISNARLRRMRKRNRQELRERMRNRREMSHEDLQAVPSPSTAQMQTTESSPVTDQNNGNHDEIEDESQGARRARELLASTNPPEIEETNFSKILKSFLTYPDTEVKRSWESSQVAHQRSGNSGAKKLEEQQELQCMTSPREDSEEIELSSENLENTSYPVTVEKHFNQSDTDKNLNGKEIDGDSVNPSRVSSEHLDEGRSQSFPTSPDVRRRFPSLENTLRRWSSWR